MYWGVVIKKLFGGSRSYVHQFLSISTNKDLPVIFCLYHLSEGLMLIKGLKLILLLLGGMSDLGC